MRRWRAGHGAHPAARIVKQLRRTGAAATPKDEGDDDGGSSRPGVPPERVQCWSGSGPATSSSGEALLLDPAERPPGLAAYRVVPPLWACPGSWAAATGRDAIRIEAAL